MAASSSSFSDVNSCSVSPSQTLENYICQRFCELDNEEGRELIRRQLKKSKARWKKYCKRKGWPCPEVHYKPVNPEVLSLKENLYEETEEIIEKIVETRRHMRGKVKEIETNFLQQDLDTLTTLVRESDHNVENVLTSTVVYEEVDNSPLQHVLDELSTALLQVKTLQHLQSMTFQNGDTVHNHETPQNRDTSHVIFKGQTELHLLNNADKIIDELYGLVEEEQGTTFHLEHKC